MVGDFLVLCMGSDSVLWAEVILLGLVGCLCYTWAQILCYRQRLCCCGWWFSCALHGLRFFAMDRSYFVVVGGFLCYAWAPILCYGQT